MAERADDLAGVKPQAQSMRAVPLRRPKPGPAPCGSGLSGFQPCMDQSVSAPVRSLADLLERYRNDARAARISKGLNERAARV